MFISLKAQLNNPHKIHKKKFRQTSLFASHIDLLSAFLVRPLKQQDTSTNVKEEAKRKDYEQETENEKEKEKIETTEENSDVRVEMNDKAKEKQERNVESKARKTDDEKLEMKQDSQTTETANIKSDLKSIMPAQAEDIALSDVVLTPDDINVHDTRLNNNISTDPKQQQENESNVDIKVDKNIVSKSPPNDANLIQDEDGTDVVDDVADINDVERGTDMKDEFEYKVVNGDNVDNTGATVETAESVGVVTSTEMENVAKNVDNEDDSHLKKTIAMTSNSMGDGLIEYPSKDLEVAGGDSQRHQSRNNETTAVSDQAMAENEDNEEEKTRKLRVDTENIGANVDVGEAQIQSEVAITSLASVNLGDHEVVLDDATDNRESIDGNDHTVQVEVEVKTAAEVLVDQDLDGEDEKQVENQEINNYDTDKLDNHVVSGRDEVVQQVNDVNGDENINGDEVQDSQVKLISMENDDVDQENHDNENNINDDQLTQMLNEIGLENIDQDDCDNTNGETNGNKNMNDNDAHFKNNQLLLACYFFFCLFVVFV